MNKRTKVILIFDIGKLDQKFFLLDRNFSPVLRGQTAVKELLDDDGDPGPDLDGITTWIAKVILNCLESEEHHVYGINFTTDGASLVNLAESGERVSPFYDGNKQFPYPLFTEFALKYSDGGLRDLRSGSPGIGLFNSGFQLYWLKYRKPEIYRKIKWSLHLPQYFSHLLTGIPVSDYTSLGCHSALWNYETQKYDQWVLAEKVDRKLAPLVSTYTSIKTSIFERQLLVGVGIHNIAAALLPYLSSRKVPFIFVSTGTCCMSINPFADGQLTAQDIARGSLYLMNIDGRKVMANRCYLGFQFQHHLQELSGLFNSSLKKIKKIKYDSALDQAIRKSKERYFPFEDPDEAVASNSPLPEHFKLKKAYHQLMVELVNAQVQSIKSIIKKTDVRKMIIEGEFVHNELFIKMIAHQFEELAIYASSTSDGSAFGSAIALVPEWWSKKHFKRHYRLERVG